MIPTASSVHAAQGALPHPNGFANPNRGRVLHVDDDPISGLALQVWLESNGYACVSVASTGEADTALQAQEFDLVISDIHMPGNHGLEWVETLLNSKSKPAVILLTGSPAIESACRAANLPVSGYLIKPPDWNSLDARLQQIISAQRQQRDFATLLQEISAHTSSQPANIVGEENRLLRLAGLASSLARHSRMLSPGDAAEPARLRQALLETIAVLEKTKHSFRSKELGRLRQHLQQMLDRAAAA